MNANNPAFQSAMNALRQKYAGHLLERVEEIRSLLSQNYKKEFVGDARNRLYNHAHSLAGSGATYGYPEITKAARALETAIDENAAQEKLLTLTQSLITVCTSITSKSAASGASIISKPKDLDKDKKTLFLIDDDASIGAFVTQMFKDSFNVIVYGRGADGLAAINAGGPDIVLLDGTLTDAQGLKLLETLKADPVTAKIPVIMVTAHNQSAYVGQAIKAGAADYVVKPLDPKILQAKVTGLLTRAGA